jgi:hypothetical protein
VLIRLLDFAFLTFLVWLVWSQVVRALRAVHPAGARSGGRAAEARAAGGGASPDSGAGTVTLVRCGACGVHVPSGRALPGRTAAELFCSEACRARGARPAS